MSLVHLRRPSDDGHEFHQDKPISEAHTQPVRAMTSYKRSFKNSQNTSWTMCAQCHSSVSVSSPESASKNSGNLREPQSLSPDWRPPLRVYYLRPNDIHVRRIQSVNHMVLDFLSSCLTIGLMCPTILARSWPERQQSQMLCITPP